MSIEPIVPAHVIRTDEEAISVADEVAKIIRKGAIDRDQKRLLPQFEVELLSRRGLLDFRFQRNTVVPVSRP